jgi:hypothetical protein
LGLSGTSASFGTNDERPPNCIHATNDERLGYSGLMFNGASNNVSCGSVEGSYSYECICSAFCPAGNYCPDAANGPIPCNAGTFSPHAGQSSNLTCTQCTLGQYCPTGTATPAECLAGNYCPDAATSVSCTIGQHCPAGTTAPADCPAGNYCPDAATSASCTTGQHCPAGTTTPVECPLGNYCPDAANGPIPCNAGTFSPHAGQSSNLTCTQCILGQHCPTGTATPAECPLGNYCPNTSVLTPCEIGTFSPRPSQTSSSTCVGCPSDAVQPFPGRPRCIVSKNHTELLLQTGEGMTYLSPQVHGIVLFPPPC